MGRVLPRQILAHLVDHRLASEGFHRPTVIIVLVELRPPVHASVIDGRRIERDDRSTSPVTHRTARADLLSHDERPLDLALAAVAAQTAVVLVERAHHGACVEEDGELQKAEVGRCLKAASRALGYVGAEVMTLTLTVFVLAHLVHSLRRRSLRLPEARLVMMRE